MEVVIFLSLSPDIWLLQSSRGPKGRRNMQPRPGVLSSSSPVRLIFDVISPDFALSPSFVSAFNSVSHDAFTEAVMTCVMVWPIYHNIARRLIVERVLAGHETVGFGLYIVNFFFVLSRKCFLKYLFSHTWIFSPASSL